MYVSPFGVAHPEVLSKSTGGMQAAKELLSSVKNGPAVQGVVGAQKAKYGKIANDAIKAVAVPADPTKAAAIQVAREGQAATKAARKKKLKIAAISAGVAGTAGGGSLAYKKRENIKSYAHSRRGSY